MIARFGELIRTRAKIDTLPCVAGSDPQAVAFGRIADVCTRGTRLRRRWFHLPR
jgi:hypothetical protein